MVARFVITTAYVAILTTIGCAMPFFGDFLALVSARPALLQCRVCAAATQSASVGSGAALFCLFVWSAAQR